MKVFLSWSGKNSVSHQVAIELRRWLPYVCHSARPWLSNADIRPGTTWGTKLRTELNDTEFGIFCVTRKSAQAPWLLFEAGAISKSSETSHVIPYLIDLEEDELPGPLQQFMCVSADREGTLALCKELIEGLPEERKPEMKVEDLFDRNWPELKGNLRKIKAKAKSETSEPADASAQLTTPQRTFETLQCDSILQGNEVTVTPGSDLC